MIINLKIVRVNSNYCDYLRKYDNKVAYNKNEKEFGFLTYYVLIVKCAAYWLRKFYR